MSVETLTDEKIQTKDKEGGPGSGRRPGPGGPKKTIAKAPKGTKVASAKDLKPGKKYGVLGKSGATYKGQDKDGNHVFQHEKTGNLTNVPSGQVPNYDITHEDGSQETNATSNAGQLFRKGAAKKGIKEAGTLNIRGHFLEAEINEGAREVPVIIIQEGLGNKRDMHFYTKEALAKSVGRFDGAQCYADHPTKSESSDRPERSIRDLIGFYKSPEVIDYKGKAAIKAILKVLGGDAYNWAWDLVKEAVTFAKDFPDKDLVGISINANGATHAGDGQDDNLINYVDEITDVFSSDVVTKAGAGGKIGAGLRESVKKYIEAKAKNLKEAGKFMKQALSKIHTEMETLKGKKEAGEVDDKAYSDGMAELLAQLKDLVDQAPAESEGEGETDPETTDDAATTDKKPAEGEGEAEGEAKKIKEAAAVTAKLTEENAALKMELKLIKSRDSVKKWIKEAKLRPGTYDDLLESLLGKDEKYAKRQIDSRKKLVATLTGGVKIDGQGEVTIKEADDKGEKPCKDIYAGLEK